MISISGIGTRLYGKADVRPDSSYIATKWFTWILLPIFPLGSYRVWQVEEKKFVGFGFVEKYKMVKVKFNLRQILITYLLIWGGLIVIPFFLLSTLFTFYSSNHG